MDCKHLKPQKINEGYGAKYHRIYTVILPMSLAAAQRAMQDLQLDLDQCSPQLLANFEKTSGNTRRLRVGDEFLIHIAGPWDGPVRVSSVQPNEFKLVTLEGHLEAGEIIFRLKEISENETRFEIESMARSRDAIVDFFYDKIPIAKAAQTQMWTSFCQSFAQRAAQINQLEPRELDVKISTERFDEESTTWQPL